MYDRILDILHGMLISGFFVGGMYFFKFRKESHKPTKLRLFMSVLLMTLCVLTSIMLSSSFYGPVDMLIHKPESVLTLFLLVTPSCTAIFAELIRVENVSNRKVLCRTAIQLLLAVIYFTLLSCDLPGCEIVFIVYLLYVLPYILYYIYACAKSFFVYRKELEQVYADVQDRSINWISGMLLFFLSLGLSAVILQAVLQTALATVLFHVLMIIFWLTFSHFIGRMRDASLVETQEETGELWTAAGEPTKKRCGCSDSIDTDTTIDHEAVEFVDKVRATIIKEKLYSDVDLTRNDVALAVGTNYCYLIQNIRRVTDMTFSQFINDLRLTVAEEMLKTDVDSIEDISVACGFRARSTFYRLFANKYGCPPSSYRSH